MQSLRNAHSVIRFVLVWFALSVGVAMASPLIKPQPMELICATDGAVRLLVQTDEGIQELSSQGVDCSLCVLASAPPPVIQFTVEPQRALSHVLHPIVAARIAALIAAPLPARGPPAFS
jgi:hypothetical protein